MRFERNDERGGVSILVLGVVAGACCLMLVLAAVGGGFVAHAELQQAVDVAAASVESGADAPASRARALARANGAARVRVDHVDGGSRIRIRAWRRGPAVSGISEGMQLSAVAYAALPPPSLATDGGPNPPGEYRGPLALVKGVRVCPAVAAAFRRMDAVAAQAGIAIVPTSGYRSFAEQAVLYARLGPAIAAPPGASRHHDATELDINVGPAGSAIHRWLQAHGPSHGFTQRYSWEPWHWGFVAGC